MDIKEIAELIVKKSFVFQVSIPGTNFTHGKTTVSMALSDSENVEGYLQKIAKSNKANHLFIKLFSPNGSSFKPKGEHLIFLPQSETVATTATNVAEPATNVATPATNVAKQQNEMGNPFQKPNTMDQKDYINYKVLEIQHTNLQGIYDETKAKVVKLEKRVEELHDENKQLLRSAAVQDDKHSIALERAKLDMEREGKDGLAGVIGEITKDPELLKMAIGFFKPDHPMFKEQAEQKTLEGAPDPNRAIQYTEDKDVNQVLNDIPRMLSQKDGNTIGAIYMLFQEFVSKPETLVSAINTYIPDFNK